MCRYTHTIGNNIVCQRLFIIGIRRRIEDDSPRIEPKKLSMVEQWKKFPFFNSLIPHSLSCFEPPLFFPVKAYSLHLSGRNIYLLLSVGIRYLTSLLLLIKMLWFSSPLSQLEKHIVGTALYFSAMLFPIVPIVHFNDSHGANNGALLLRHFLVSQKPNNI